MYRILAWAVIVVGLAACGTTDSTVEPPAPTSAIYHTCSLGTDSVGICRVFPDGSGFTLVAPSLHNIPDPRVSRDGRFIAFACPGKTELGLCVMNFDGSAPRQVIDHGAVTEPVWSPSNDRIAFIGNSRLWVVNADGTGETQVTPDTLLVVSPDWSPDGKYIVVSEPGPGDDLWRVKPDGSDLTRLTGLVRAPAYPRWSPDGSKILYMGNAYSGATDLFVWDSVTKSATSLVTLGDVGSAAWSPDGSSFVVEKWDGYNFELFTRAIAGGRMTKITSATTEPFAGYPSWAPWPAVVQQ